MSVIKLVKILHINHAKVILKPIQNAQCSDCKSSCSQGFMKFLFNKHKDENIIVNRSSSTCKASHLTDNNTFFNEKHRINDIVGIKFDESQVFRLSLILYGLPIIIIVLTLMIGYQFFSWISFNPDFGGILGMIVGLFFAKLIIKSAHYRIKPQVSFFK